MNNIKLNKIIKFLGNPNIFVFGIAWMIVLVVVGTIAQREVYIKLNKYFFLVG